MEHPYTGPVWGEGMDYSVRENFEFQRIFVIHSITGEMGLYNFEEEQMINSLQGCYYDEDDLFNVFVDLKIDLFNMIPPNEYPTIVRFALRNGVSPTDAKWENDVLYCFFVGHGWLNINEMGKLT